MERFFMKNNTSSNMTNWIGRVDHEDGELGLRWHQKVKEANSTNQDGIMLLGFVCDEGVIRNKGRKGAYAAPQVIRRALANLAWHHQSDVYDGGDIRCNDNDLELAQKQLGIKIKSALANRHQVIVLGGGHEVAWGSFQGIARYLQSRAVLTSPTAPPRIGIINFDAHFDLRNLPQSPSSSTSQSSKQYGSSGTPFHQISEFCHVQHWPFHYACLGLNKGSNTQALYHKAKQLGVLHFDDIEMNLLNLPQIKQALSEFIEQNDFLYLTIDIDVFPASCAPGVSAPAVRGVSLDIIESLLPDILKAKNQHGEFKLLLADLAEFNPTFDIDNQTARLVARLVWTIAHGMKSNM
ncbi:formimidoylglutamase [Aliivibrio fischeri]|nr:formimidoylglutamase [Aliivibrio fischeri]